MRNNEDASPEEPETIRKLKSWKESISYRRMSGHGPPPGLNSIMEDSRGSESDDEEDYDEKADFESRYKLEESLPTTLYHPSVKEVLLAAAHMDDAFTGELDDDFKRPSLQIVQNQLNKFLRFVNIIYLFHGLFERPVWCYRTSCGDPAITLLSGAPMLPLHWTRGLDAICLACFFLQMAIECLAKGYKSYFRGRLLFRSILLGLEMTSLLVTHFLNFAPVGGLFRPAVVLLSHSTHTRVFVDIVKTAWQVSDVLVLALLIIGFYAALANLIFQDFDAIPNSSSFSTFEVSFLSSFVLFTTSNFPDIMIPAYETSRLWSLLFIGFLVLVYFFLTNFLLGAVLDTYKTVLHRDEEDFKDKRNESIAKCFNLLSGGHTFISEGAAIRMVRKLHQFRYIPFVNDGDEEYFVSLLMGSEDAYETRQSIGISRHEFNRAIEILQYKIIHNHEQTAAEEDGGKDYWLKLLIGEEKLTSLVHMARSRHYLVCYSLLTLVNVFALYLLIKNTFEPTVSNTRILLIELAFTVVFTLEVIFKVCILGWVEYWLLWRNRFDFITSILSLLLEITILIPQGYDNVLWIRYVLLMRMIRMAQVFQISTRFRSTVVTFRDLLTPLSRMFLVLLIILLSYASLGVHLFGGMLSRDNPRLAGTDFDDADYYVNNFNDIISALVTLFELIVVNNWFITMDGVACASGNEWTRVYFLLFYFFGVLVIFNLFASTVISAYSARRELFTSEEQEKKQRNAVKRLRAVSSVAKVAARMRRRSSTKSDLSEDGEEERKLIAWIKAVPLLRRESDVYELFQ